MSKKQRISIPKTLSFEVLYKSRWCCCICKHKSVQIHHIDENPNNNVESNLAPLCPNCHARVHATSRLDRQISADEIIEAKSRWEKQVAEDDCRKMSIHANSQCESRDWMYFDFRRILAIAEQMRIDLALRPAFGYAKSIGVIDSVGFPMTGGCQDVENTVFASHSRSDAWTLQSLYCEIVEAIIAQSTPIDLARAWTFAAIRSVINRPRLAFLNKGFRFSAVRGSEGLRRARYKKSHIHMEFIFDEWNVYSKSALWLHLSGHSRVAALVLVRGAEVEYVSGSRICNLQCSAVALGAGFWPDSDTTPSVAWRDESVDDDAE